MKKLGFKIWFLFIMLFVSFLFIFAGSGLTKKGIAVTSIGSENNSLFDQGLRKGMVVNSIDEQEITSMEDFNRIITGKFLSGCLLYTSDAADDLTRVDLGGRRIIKKK